MKYVITVDAGLNFRSFGLAIGIDNNKIHYSRSIDFGLQIAWFYLNVSAREANV